MGLLGRTLSAWELVDGVGSVDVVLGSVDVILVPVLPVPASVTSRDEVPAAGALLPPFTSSKSTQKQYNKSVGD